MRALRRKKRQMNSKICQAIRDRKILKFEYKGLKRVVEPHCHGTSTKGKETLRAYQIKGNSRNGGLPDWRPFSVRKMKDIKVSESSFEGKRAGYNPKDSMMRGFCCNL